MRRTVGHEVGCLTLRSTGRAGSFLLANVGAARRLA